MKLLMVHNYYQQPGGEDRVFEEECRLMEAHGHTVIPYIRHNDEIKKRSRIAVASDTVWNRGASREIFDLVRRNSVDVMHCANTFPLISPSIYSAARSAGAAVVQTLHNYRLICPAAQLVRDGQSCSKCVGKTFAWPAIRHACYRGSKAATAVTALSNAVRRMPSNQNDVDQYIALSEAARTELIAGGLPKTRIVVKPNFVDPDPGIRPGKGNYFVFVGRLSPEKGVETLLSTWRDLSSGFQLKIVGDGPLASLVQASADERSHIKWLGRRSPDEVFDIVGNARASIVPSTWKEPFGRTVIESFATGTPVIGSDLGALPEIITPEHNGLIVKAGDTDALRHAVQKIDAAGDFAAMRRNSRDTFENLYTAEANYPQLIDVYERAVAVRHRNSHAAAELQDSSL
ncbi:glycosyltransferase family 4 protein [Stratiformator vulcanicus]|uniref:Glycogen synthase n=1 Tax=Stratiformator vulcanicus TaxID=2527980 RepID=A0A517QWF3_9PLAN|nr:glycosyltransferase family 4 protein [Stratiformator vulcanicus]QDT35898.1 Glycogen synthase [Stratiformator vulcanicus]